MILFLLDRAKSLSDIDVHSLSMHPLKGELKGSYALKVNANWRILFRFVSNDAYDVDYLDYH